VFELSNRTVGRKEAGEGVHHVQVIQLQDARYPLTIDAKGQFLKNDE
jgi:hypothetical protein